MTEAQKTLNVNASELAYVAKLARELPADCRQVFTLRKVYGYSGKEIANRLGMAEQAVEALLVQAARIYAQAEAIDLARRPTLLERLRARIAHE